MPVAPVKTE
jgi:precorrin-2 dehydrogenase/sirohydrochlorin ferrochelatase